jgi:hypothetical protein
LSDRAASVKGRNLRHMAIIRLANICQSEDAVADIEFLLSRISRVFSLTLKMEATRSSETSVLTNYTRRKIP